MNSDRWKQIDSLLQAVLERPPGERDAFLRHASAGDQALEREVRSLLTSQQEAGNFLESPAVEAVVRAIALDHGEGSPENPRESSGSLAPGAQLGSYEIVAPLGAGGMGEVYLARDT